MQQALIVTQPTQHCDIADKALPARQSKNIHQKNISLARFQGFEVLCKCFIDGADTIIGCAILEWQYTTFCAMTHKGLATD